jgi:hypothetical protein
MSRVLDEVDQHLADEALAARRMIDGPITRDYVKFPTGKMERLWISRDGHIQTSPAGSFFLFSNGYAEFSGSLNPLISASSLSLREEIELGEFWFFHHGEVGPGRGVHFSIPCRVYATTEDYNGYRISI